MKRHPRKRATARSRASKRQPLVALKNPKPHIPAPMAPRFTPSPALDWDDESDVRPPPDIKWGNVLLHCAIAFPMGAVAGAGLHMGLTWFEPWGKLLGTLSIAAALGAALYWPVRELRQHGGEWGGRQSTWEWVAPVVVIPLGMAAGWWVSWLLL